jgi:hypothetical protein
MLTLKCINVYNAYLCEFYVTDEYFLASISELKKRVLPPFNTASFFFQKNIALSGYILLEMHICSVQYIFV